MKKEIKFSLVFRDMWQSAGKYVPRVDQLVKVAPAIIEMGCFARVETNGGGFEQTVEEIELRFKCGFTNVWLRIWKSKIANRKSKIRNLMKSSSPCAG